MLAAALVVVVATGLVARRLVVSARRHVRRSAADLADSAYVLAHYTKHEYRIPMRDGVHLFTQVYVPKNASPARAYPFLLERTPFSVSPYGARAYPRMLGPDRYTMRDGYIFVYQDVRGRYLSEGTFENVRPLLPDSVKARDPRATDEATDAYDTIAWLLAHVPGNNGKAGVWGISYPGFYAAEALLSRHPALVAASPQAPVTDLYFEDYHHNGALTQGYFTSYPIFGIPRSKPTPDNWWLDAFQKLNAMARPDDYQWQLSLGPVSTFGARFYQGNTLWRDIVAHPDRDDFWQTRAVAPRLRGVSQAVLLAGGWFDGEDLYGPLALDRALEANDPQATVTLAMGPFGHRGWAATDNPHTIVGNLSFGDSLADHFQRDVEAPFFRSHLKGEGAAPTAGAMMFDTGRKRWVQFTRWPPPESKAAYFLRADGGLSTSAPANDAASRAYRSDPASPVPTRCQGSTIADYTLYMDDDQRCFDRRPDVLTFETGPLPADVTVAGPITARLWVSTTGTDADFVVKLIDVYPDDAPGEPWVEHGAHMGGYQQLVRGDIMPARYRLGFDAPAPLVADTRVEVDVPLLDVLHTFAAGHRIMVQVQSSWFPMFARNPQRFVPNVYEAPASAFVPESVRVWTARGAASGLELPIITR